MKVRTGGLPYRCQWHLRRAQLRLWIPWPFDRRGASERARVPRHPGPPRRPEASRRGSMAFERPLRLVRDARSEWGSFAFVPFLTPAYLAALLLFGGEIRPEHWILGIFVPVLGFAGVRGARFLRDVYPWLFVITSYDSVRYARAAVLRAENVMGCGLRSAELRFFSVAPGTTLQDWFVAHHRLGLDLFFAVSYGVFAYFALIYASYLYVKDRPRMRRFLWAFALANLMSYALWLLVP